MFSGAFHYAEDELVARDKKFADLHFIRFIDPAGLVAVGHDCDRQPEERSLQQLFSWYMRINRDTKERAQQSVMRASQQQQLQEVGHYVTSKASRMRCASVSRSASLLWNLPGCQMAITFVPNSSTTSPRGTRR